MALISPSRFALLAGAVSLTACVAAGPDIRAVQRELDGKALSAFDQAYAAGKASLQSNRVGLALVQFEKALAIDPKSVAALNAVGAAYDELHFPNIAARYYAKALALEPNSADTLNNMALSARLAGRTDDARALFERALAADAANRTIHANLDAIDAPVQTAAAAPSEEDAPADAPVVERTGQNAFKLVLPLAPAVRAQAISVEPLPMAMLAQASSVEPLPTAMPAQAVEPLPTSMPAQAMSVEPLPTAMPAHAISVEPLPAPAAPVHAELNPREQAVRARIAAFFTAREEHRRAAATETVIAISTMVAPQGDVPTRRASAERAWFNLFRTFFEQRQARQPAEDRKDASSRAARNG